MDHTQHNALVGFIWGIADDILRDVYVRGKYRDVILPMTVIRRLDALLEPTKEAVLSMKAHLDKAQVANQEAALCKEAGQAFYNASPFTLRRLLDNPKQLRANFETYLTGFSSNVQEILLKFKFHNQIPTLSDADALGNLIEKFISPDINLSPKPVLDGAGNVRLPGLDNHSMGTVFEELIRRFNEENNEEAGEHFTPRDVVRLMAGLIFAPIADRIESGTYLVYDGACGTGGMLTASERKTLIDAISWRDPEAPPVVKKTAKDGTLEYEPDPDLRDTEQVPFLEAPPSGLPGGLPTEDTAREGIAAFFQRECLPYVPDLPAPRPSPGQFCVYVLTCSDTSFYIGQTDDFPRRLREHEEGQVSWTGSRLPLEPIHWEIFTTREEAVKRESDLKTGFGRQWLKREYEAGRLQAASRQAGAWIDHGKTKIGYELSFTRYFYKPQPLRTLDEIKADILAVEKESEGLLEQIIGEGEK